MNSDTITMAHSKNQQSSFTYDVKRDVYNEETFQREHRRKSTLGNMDIDITTFSHRIQCSCSWHKFQRCMMTVFPFLEWMCLYRFKDWLLGDLVAGINVGLVQIPQGLTFSLMSRQLIPPLNISYSAFCSSVIYVLFGSCHQMSIGFFFLASALMVNVLELYPFNNGNLLLGAFIKSDFSDPSYFVAYNKSLSVMASTTFLTGIIQLSMGLLGFGFIATYLPEAVINAYLSATALHVLMSQLTAIFGVMISFHSGPLSFFYNMINYCLRLPKANSTSILLFLTAIVTLRINKCIRISFNQYSIEFPMEAFLILGFALFASKISMATESSKTLIDMAPYSYLLPVTPEFEVIPRVVLQAISLALVSSSLLIFLGKKVASYHNYRVNSNQDLIVIGLCNVVSSFFRSCVFTGAVIRTIIQDKSGGRQQFASLVGAGLMLLLMVKVRSFFYNLPNAVLAGIVMSNLLPYFETVFYLHTLWRQNQYDFVIWIVTFLAALILGLDLGLLVSIFFAFLMVTVQSHRTKIVLLGQIPNTNIYRSITDYREIVTIPGVKIMQCCNSITFVNVHNLKKQLLKEMGMVNIPLKEEEILYLFTQNDDDSETGKMCRCYCNCDELEPPPRIVYTERYESLHGQDSYSNMLHFSRVESEISQSETEEQAPNTLSFTSQSNPGQIYEEVRMPPPSNPSRKSLMPGPAAVTSNQMKNRSVERYSDGSFPPSIHTIILDFSMVHFVDSQASVVLRQMCNAFQNANILVLIAGCHSSVVRSLERNDFFDEGISKAQMFLTLHDAVLFALSRKIRNYSQLSLDESETVIQETFSESDKMDSIRYKASNSYAEVPKITSPGFTFEQPEAEESSGMESTEMEDMLESPEDSTPQPDEQMEPELEQEPSIDVEPEIESEFESEPELQLNSKTRIYPLPRKQQPFQYVVMPPRSPSYSQAKKWSIDKRHQYMKPRSSKGNYNDESYKL